MGEPVMLVLSGPSGAGKTTVARRLLKENKFLRRAVTCTTREPREGEVDGKDYFFLTNEEFTKTIEGSFHFLISRSTFAILRGWNTSALRP